MFGICGSRFGVFATAMAFSPRKTVTITLVMVALDNKLQTKGQLLYTDENALDRENKDGSVTEGNWKKNSTKFTIVLQIINGYYQRNKNNLWRNVTRI